jgi:hypothetical protein
VVSHPSWKFLGSNQASADHPALVPSLLPSLYIPAADHVGEFDSGDVFHHKHLLRTEVKERARYGDSLAKARLGTGKASRMGRTEPVR